MTSGTISLGTIRPGTISPGTISPGTTAGNLAVAELESAPAAGVRCAGDEDGVQPLPLAALSARNQRGMVSAEWAVGIIAAVAIAGVLLGIVTSGPVHDALLDFILMVIRSFSGFVK